MSTKLKNNKRTVNPNKYCGIFCLETGDWFGDLKNSVSVIKMLEYLKNTFNIPYIHRTIATKNELEFYLSELGHYTDFPYIYLAFHGNANQITLADEKSINLEEMPGIGFKRLKGRILHFGSCGTAKHLGASNKEKIRKEIGADAIIGYSRKIDFFDSSILDLAVMYKFASNNSPSRIKATMAKEYQQLMDKCGMIIL
jgi:hypothetical protein